MKFIVGAMATTFGIFWTTEGLRIEWPFADLSIILIAVLVVIVSFGCIIWLRAKTPGEKAKKKSERAISPAIRALSSALEFIYDLVIGDEWVTGVSLWILVVISTFVTIPAGAWYLVLVFFTLILPLGLRKQITLKK
jgi:hypothetical protein